MKITADKLWDFSLFVLAMVSIICAIHLLIVTNAFGNEKRELKGCASTCLEQLGGESKATTNVKIFCTKLCFTIAKELDMLKEWEKHYPENPDLYGDVKQTFKKRRM